MADRCVSPCGAEPARSDFLGRKARRRGRQTIAATGCDRRPAAHPRADTKGAGDAAQDRAADRDRVAARAAGEGDGDRGDGAGKFSRVRDLSKSRPRRASASTGVFPTFTTCSSPRASRRAAAFAAAIPCFSCSSFTHAPERPPSQVQDRQLVSGRGLQAADPAQGMSRLATKTLESALRRHPPLTAWSLQKWAHPVKGGRRQSRALIGAVLDEDLVFVRLAARSSVFVCDAQGVADLPAPAKCGTLHGMHNWRE